jgi:hypothetical protein
MNEDIIFDCFNKVVGFDQNQIIRYSRGENFPLWFNKHKMLINKNKFCSKCKAQMIYEFQVIYNFNIFFIINYLILFNFYYKVMPNIFNIMKEIMNIDIGTIVVYTCKNSCDKNKYIEEYAYVQRSGDKMIELKDLKMIEDLRDGDFGKKDEKEFEDLNKLKIKGNSNNIPDDDGFIQIKKKGKK